MVVGSIMLRKDLYTLLFLGEFLSWDENPGIKLICLPSAWVHWICSPDVTRQMGFLLAHLHVGWGAYSMKLINLLQIITNKSTKRPRFKSSDSEPEIVYQNTPTYMVIQSTEDIPITKISPFKIAQILSKQIKPTTIKKSTNQTILIEVKKTQVEEILKWETFNNIKIKTHLHQYLNSSKEEFCIISVHTRWNKIQFKKLKCDGH